MSYKITREQKGIGSLLLATFLYGFFGVFIRFIGFNIPLFYASFIRSLIEVIILFFFIYYLKRWKQVAKKDYIWLLLRTVGGVFGYVGSYFAFYYIPIGTAYFIFYGGSVIGGYILGKFVFLERITPIKIISLTISLIGLSLIYSFNFSTDTVLYALSALVAGFGAAIWTTFSKKVSDSYDSLQLNFIDNAIFCALSVGISLLIQEAWTKPTLTPVWIANIIFGLLFIVTGQLIIYGFNRLDAQVGSLVMLTEVLFGIILSFIFFKEIISIFALFGGALVIFAIILPEIKWRK